jgi:serine/threonine-protein kinase
MAPEQALGQADLDARADVFALGVVLYEILTGHKPFTGPSFPAVLLATMTQAPTAPRAHQPSCPVVLEELCLRMLAKERAARPASAEEVAAEIDAFLDGAKERARRHAEAERLAAEASAHAARHLALAEEKDLWQARALELLRDVKGWEPVEKKLPGWELEDRGRQTQTEYAGALAAAVERYAQALGYEQDNAAVRRGLAALHWARAERCALERDEVGQIYSETLVREYDDGTLLARLTADARVSIETPIAGAEVVAFRYVEKDRILRAGAGQALGKTPIREARLAPGSYVLTIASEGFRVARYPLVARRGERHQARVNLYSDDEIGPDLIYVPGGACVIGGDPEAFDGLARQEVVVPDFAIGRFPITFDEYLVFINDLATRDPAAAERRLPCASDTSEGLFVERDPRGLWAPKWEAIIAGEQGRALAPREHVGRVPVCCIDWFDAVAYCRWRSERDGRSCRLLTEFEREKAARGVDGRWFPWGDRFDPTFCKMRESRPGSAQPEPVGAFPVDESPYGVRDLAGGMRDWVGDIANELGPDAALAEGEPPPGTPRDHSMLRSSRGGSWFALTSWCRAAARLRYASLYRSAYRGLRIARSLTPRG